MKNGRWISIIWIIATILEIANAGLFTLAMGYEYLDYSWYVNLREWEHIATVYYICAAIDILLFAWLVQIYKKTEHLKEIATAVFCFLVQVILLIWKVKL